MLQEARGTGAIRFLGGDFSSELGMLEKEERFVSFYGLFYWGRRKADLVSNEKEECVQDLWTS